MVHLVFAIIITIVIVIIARLVSTDTDTPNIEITNPATCPPHHHPHPHHFQYSHSRAQIQYLPTPTITTTTTQPKKTSTHNRRSPMIPILLSSVTEVVAHYNQFEFERGPRGRTGIDLGGYHRGVSSYAWIPRFGERLRLVVVGWMDRVRVRFSI